MSEIPARIGPYRIQELLGQGGMGVVYRGTHGITGQIAAIKTVRVPRAGMLQSIRREIHALARLRHPGIVPILEEGLENGVPWYAMELIAGVTLRRHADMLGPVHSGEPTPTKTGSIWWTQTLETVPSMQRAMTASRIEPAPARLEVGPNLQILLTVVRRLCGLLAFLHGEGIVHRDLKPENILLRPDGMPVLMDFGVVSRFGGELSREELEVAGKVSGTVAYMSPEQGRGELVDARADLYSLGCILYELTVGRPPFSGETPLQVLRQHLKVPPTRPSELVQGVDPELETLILRLLEKDPHRRLGHADDVSKALARLGASNGWNDAIKPRAYLYRSRFVGRHEPLLDLLRLLELASECRGSIALVGGESGIGKTRLAMELASEAHRRDARVITGECSLAGGPLQGLRSLLQAIADRCREGGLPVIERVLGRSGSALAKHEPSLRALPGLDVQTDPENVPAEAARGRLFRALTEVISAYANDCRTPIGGGPASGPLVLILDDLQWADELTLGFLDHFRQSGAVGFWEDRRDSNRASSSKPSSGTPLLIVGTYRSEEVGRDARTGDSPSPLQRIIEAPEITQIKLDRLEDSAIASLVGDMLAMAAPPEGFVQSLAAHAEGNAFFIAEYLRTAVSEGLLFRDAAGSWRTAAIGGSEPGRRWNQSTWYEALRLPDSIHALVSRRLQALPEPCSAVVDAAAVVGRESRLALLHAMSGLDEAGFFEATGDLLRRQVLESASVESLRFLHDQLREVALERIPQARARTLHRVAAEAIEAGKESRGASGRAEPESESVSALAHHWDEAGETTRGAHFWVEAGQNALGVYAVGEAEAALDRAIGALEGAQGEAATADVLRALDARSRLRDHIGRFQDAAADAVRMASLSMASGDELRLGRALRQEGVSLYNAGDYDSALDRYQKALAVLERVGEPEEICETRHLIGWIHHSRGEFAQAVQQFESALATAGLRPDSLAAWDSRMQLGLTMWALGQFERAKSLIEALLHDSPRRVDPLRQARCQSALGLLHRERGEWEPATKLLQAANEVFLRAGALQDSLVCTNNLGLTLIDRGRSGQAEPIFWEMRESAGRLGETLLQGIAEVQLSCCRLCQDDVDAALSLARAAVERFEELGSLSWLRQAFLRLALAQSANSADRDAEVSFNRALELCHSVKTPSQRWRVCTLWAIDLLEKDGDPERARSLVTEAFGCCAQIEQRQPGLIIGAFQSLLATQAEEGVNRDQAWNDFLHALSGIGIEDRFVPIAQRLFLLGSRWSLRQGHLHQAEALRRRYGAIAHLEDARQERLSRQLETEISAHRSSTQPQCDGPSSHLPGSPQTP